MKLNYSFIRAIFALIIGLVFMFMPDKSADYVVVTIGVLFLIPGIIALLAYYSLDKSIASDTKIVNVNKRFPVEALGSLLLGAWLIIDPGFFNDLLMIVLSIVLFLGGLQQIYMLLRVRKWKKAPFGYYIMPLIIFFAGVFILLNPNMARKTIIIVIGIACVVYAVTEIFNYFMFVRKMNIDEIKGRSDEGE